MPDLIVEVSDHIAKITFGDGQKGRRLPGGGNNVKVVFRKGAGIKGNLAAGHLTKLKVSHKLIASCTQPLPASGGSERENEQSMRENAPAATLTLDRAVSLRDYVYLAQRHPIVHKASAFANHTMNGAETVDLERFCAWQISPGD